MKLVIIVFFNIKVGEVDFVIVGGIEFMFGVGFILFGVIRGGYKMVDFIMKDYMILDVLIDVYYNIYMGIIVENIVERYGIIREE